MSTNFAGFAAKLSGVDDTHTVVLVEGLSDKSAVEALAERRGRSLTAEGIEVVAMGGATNIAAYVGKFGPSGRDLRLAGLCDAGEEGAFRGGSSAPASGPISREAIWRRSDSSCAWPTWKTS